MTKTIEVKNDRYIIFGTRKNAVALGLQISKWGLDLDLLFIWISVEW
jgi:hypothetical protein